MRKKFFKWACAHRLQASALFACIYMCLFLLAERLIQDPVWIVHCGLDDRIPFLKFTVIFYCAWFVEIGMSVLCFLKGEDKEFLRIYLALCVSGISCLLFYFLVPNGLNMRPADTAGTDLFSILVRIIHSADTPNNVCPSLHVIFCVVMDMEWQDSSYLRHDTTKTRSILIHLLNILIILSTVTLKQHSVIDIAAGLVWALAWEKVVRSCLLKE